MLRTSVALRESASLGENKRGDESTRYIQDITPTLYKYYIYDTDALKEQKITCGAFIIAACYLEVFREIWCCRQA